jgi:hypothetical protein
LRCRFVVGSIATHAVLLGGLALTTTRERPRQAEVLEIELRRVAPSIPPTHDLAPPTPAPQPRALIPSAPVRPAPAPAAADPTPEPEPEPLLEPEPPALSQAPIVPAASRGEPMFVVAQAGLWTGGATHGALGGRGLGSRRAPSAEVALVQRVDADLRRMDASFERLQFLMRAWQHNQYVTACLRQSVARGGGALKSGGQARHRVYAALTRSDREGARAELARFRKAAIDFDSIYHSARRCVELAEDE